MTKTAPTDGTAPIGADTPPATDAAPATPTKGKKAKADAEPDPAAQPDPDHFERPAGGGSFERQADGTLKQIEGPALDQEEEA